MTSSKATEALRLRVDEEPAGSGVEGSEASLEEDGEKVKAGTSGGVSRLVDGIEGPIIGGGKTLPGRQYVSRRGRSMRNIHPSWIQDGE